jgi:hypothetical protein
MPYINHRTPFIYFQNFSRTSLILDQNVFLNSLTSGTNLRSSHKIEELVAKNLLCLS